MHQYTATLQYTSYYVSTTFLVSDWGLSSNSWKYFREKFQGSGQLVSKILWELITWSAAVNWPSISHSSLLHSLYQYFCQFYKRGSHQTVHLQNLEPILRMRTMIHACSLYNKYYATGLCTSIRSFPTSSLAIWLCSLSLLSCSIQCWNTALRTGSFDSDWHSENTLSKVHY